MANPKQVNLELMELQCGNIKNHGDETKKKSKYITPFPFYSIYSFSIPRLTFPILIFVNIRHYFSGYCLRSSSAIWLKRFRLCFRLSPKGVASNKKPEFNFMEKSDWNKLIGRFASIRIGKICLYKRMRIEKKKRKKKKGSNTNLIAKLRNAIHTHQLVVRHQLSISSVLSSIFPEHLLLWPCTESSLLLCAVFLRALILF